MKNIKCPNCGADITTTEAQTTGKCDYCNSRFAPEKEKPVVAEPAPEPEKEFLNGDIFESKGKKRPRIKIGLLIFFAMCGPVFFISYIVITEIKKHEWDKNHNM